MREEVGEMVLEEGGVLMHEVASPLFRSKVLSAAAFGGGARVVSKRFKQETGAAVAATAAGETLEPEKAGEKTKIVRRKLSEEEIDRMLCVSEDTRPFPVVTEADLARIWDPVERERYRKVMATVTDLYFKSQEQIKQEQEYIREELATFGYVEREIEMTDEEAETGDN